MDVQDRLSLSEIWPLYARAVVVSRATRPVQREQFLDALRGIGALTVAVQHICEQIFPAFRAFTLHDFQLGQYGVMVFFLCSGYIIPASIEKDGEVWKFWVGRFFRLYPLYWASIFLALLLGRFGLFSVGHRITDDVVPVTLWNMSMLQMFVGKPNIIPVYWSLAQELVFYVLVSIFARLGIIRRSVPIALSALGVTVIVSVGLHLTGHQAPLSLFNISTMLVGTVAYRYVHSQVSRRVLVSVFALALTAGLVLLATVLYGRDDPSTLGTRSFWPMLLAWTAAYLTFSLAIRLRQRQVPVPLLYLGRISYSVYLMHPLMLIAVTPIPNPYLRVMAFIAVTIAFASLTFRYIEKPAIKAGRNLIRRPIAPAL